MSFSLLRRVVDGPFKVVPGEDYRQIRFIEVYDLLLDRPERPNCARRCSPWPGRRRAPM